MRNCENTEQLQRNRGYHVSKREDYKRFIVFCLASLVVLAQAAVFAARWSTASPIFLDTRSGVSKRWIRSLPIRMMSDAM